jgi:hypothetical protein
MSEIDPLLAEIQAAEATSRYRPCQACEALALLSPERKIAVQRALGGTIGADRLAAILTKNVAPVGKRAILNHRKEEHQ